MKGLFFRNSLLTAAGFIAGLLILALAPTLLRQTSFDAERLSLDKVRLIAMQEEQLETEELEEEPEPPPEPEEPEPPEIEPPEMAMPEIEPPQTSYESLTTGYENRVQMPSLTGLGVKGVKISAQNYTRTLRKAPLPGLPKHGPPQTRFNPDEVDKMPQAVATTQPMYPYRAKRLGVEGAVRIRFLVNKSGRAEMFKILESKPPGEFDQAVQKTVKNWKFKPAIKDGRAVETWVETTIQFKLD
ncbi:energy transducer TonB [Desulfobulbus rhabdoformis]|uniref:energy transducer TonB n=1 Tax=Desulfobulbus rhabdoformis TaxID=34032 RepID=UPI001964D523|nr:energy transducer TonB [Desulfobulbus rhabdoformis]MBM9616333.1 energy transducer TonB [Desulfobulbus rhabdoformis]